MARIAVVDDEPGFLELMQDVLSGKGHEVLTHLLGEGAFALIRKRRPQLVILDMRLEHPESGWMVLDRMRLDPETARIPVIICSADRQFLASAAEQLREEGACPLAKPFTIPELLALVQQALDPDQQLCGPDSSLARG